MGQTGGFSSQKMPARLAAKEGVPNKIKFNKILLFVFIANTINWMNIFLRTWVIYLPLSYI